MIATGAGVELESMAYHRESGTYRSRFDTAGTPASMAVVASLEAALDVDSLELGPLHDFVDPGALDDVVSVRDTTDGDISVTFSVAGYVVTVHSYGVVAIAPPDDYSDSSEHPART